MISTIFVCRDRLELSIIVLERFLDLIDQDFEIILCNHGEVPSYVDVLNGIYSFDAIINTELNKSMYHGINKGLKKAKGDYIFYLEHDWYWMYNDGLINDAIYALENKNIDMIRLFKYYMKQSHGTRLTLPNGRILIKLPYWTLHFNPSLRKEKFPVGEFVTDFNIYEAEGKMSEKAENINYSSWEMYENSFAHIGMFRHNGGPEQGIKPIMERYGQASLEDFLDLPYYNNTINSLNMNNKHKDIFEQFIRRHYILK